MDSIDYVWTSASRLLAEWDDELARYDKQGYSDTLRRLSHNAQDIARKFALIAVKAMNGADTHDPDPFFPQKHQEEIAAEVAVGEHADV